MSVQVKRLAIVGLGAVLGMAAMIGGANATILPVNETVVLFDDSIEDNDGEAPGNAVVALLVDAGISVTAIGPGDGTAPLFAFPITESTFDVGTGAGDIDHEGGLRFETDEDTLVAENFLINVENDGTGTIFGDVTSNGMFLGEDIALFTFSFATLGEEIDTLEEILAVVTDKDNPALPLFATSTLVDALTGLGLQLPDGFDGPLAFAATDALPSDLSEIPLPAAFPMFAAGIAGFAALRRRRKFAA